LAMVFWIPKIEIWRHVYEMVSFYFKKSEFQFLKIWWNLLISWHLFCKKLFHLILFGINFFVKKTHMLKKSRGLERNLTLRKRNWALKKRNCILKERLSSGPF
jgi:hypothetical protein